MKPTITVAICTWNRGALLDQTLQQMRALSVPRSCEWEIIIVNNNSTDATEAVIEKHRAALPLINVFEPRQGLSHARNAAVRRARGEFVIWTDDDVLVDTEWLVAYENAFERHTEAAVFGGKVLPWFETAPPEWLERNLDRLGRYFALRDFGDDERPLPKGQNPYGANMAFRFEVLKRHFFDPKLGRRGNLLVSGEDAQVLRKIRDAGGQIMWVPTSVVRHFLPKQRMTLRYLRELHYSNGRYEKGPITDPGPNIGGLPLWTAAEYFKHEAKFHLGRILKYRSYGWIDNMIAASSIAGRLAATRAAQRAVRNAAKE